MNPTLLAPDVPIDLSNCDLEPIHIPSSIQPHGMLFAARSSDLRIVYASANVESFLGVTPSYVLERTLPEVLGYEAVESIEEALGEELYVPKDIRTYTFPLCGGQRFDVTAHRTQGLLCLELELSNEDRRWDLLASRLEGSMQILGQAKTLPDLCAAAAPVLRALIGYDRVMVYKFAPDGHGEVVAEDKAPEMEPFLGLHYPATDIPAQARKLYLKQRFRTIVDVNYVPVPLLGNLSLIDDAPLDMTYCSLRSISPIHIEYMQNMGVGASLSISLIVGGELWGLIVGHHRTPKHISPESRALCDLSGQLVSLFVEVTQRSDEAAEERRKRFLLEVLATSIESGLQLEQSLFDSEDVLLELTGADGAVLRIGDRLSLIGRTPGPEEASSLLTAFESGIREGTASSNEVGAVLPAFSHLAASASGGLVVALGGESNCILWLRGQIAETVRWAGKPDASKHSFEGSLRLSPRKSFAVWEQTPQGLSLPWRAIEIEAALSFERIVSKALMAQLMLDLADSQKNEYDRFRLLADLMPQLVWTTTPDGKADYFNERWRSYTGTAIGESLGGAWQAAIHPDDLPNCARRWELSVATGSHYDIEYRVRRASDGAYRWHLARASPLRNDREEIVQWIGTCTDVDDQRRARNELEEQVAERTAEIMRGREHLQTVIDGATHVAIIATTPEGLITLFNSGASNMLGYTAEEVVGRHTPALFHLAPEVTARGLELTAETGSEVSGFGVFTEKTSKGKHEEREWTYVRKDTSHLPVSLVVTCLRETGGSNVGFLGVAMDLTERKRADDAARAIDEHFRLIVETVEDHALIMLDPEGHVISWNLGGERIKGYQAEEIIGKHFSVFYPPEEIESGHPDEELRIAAAKGRYSEEGWRVRKDGSRYLAEVFIAAIHDGSGKLRGFAKVIHDITERKKAEVQLRTAVRRLGLATDALNAGIWDWDIRTADVSWDDRMCEIYGMSPSTQASYQIWTNAVLPADLPSAEAVLQRVIASKSQGSYEFRIKLSDGSIRYIQAAAGAVLDDSGEVLRVIGINIDTTDRKFNEDLERQVGERTAQLRTANTALEEFAYIASHDLKAPLRVIDNASKWLEEDLAEHLTPETRETMKLMRGRVQRMERLLDDLLEYARIGRTPDGQPGESVAGDVLVDDVLALLPVDNFKITVSSGFSTIQLSRMPLQHILSNLIGNAIKHHDKPRGVIEVTVRDGGDSYGFAVRDDGPGIPAQFQEQIFKMFQTLRPRDQVEGSGMGLAMVRKTVELFGGVMSVESAEGRGSTFSFTWPKEQRARSEELPY